MAIRRGKEVQFFGIFSSFLAVLSLCTKMQLNSQTLLSSMMVFFPRLFSPSTRTTAPAPGTTAPSPASPPSLE